MLSAAKLIEHADCVLPIDNQALFRLIKHSGGMDEEMNEDEAKKKAYGDMNSIIAHLLSNLTCSMRFPGSLNIDMNEITMNLVPFPKLHFLLSSVSPLYSIKKTKRVPRSLDHIFSDTLRPENHLIDCNPHTGKYVAIGYLLRGNISFSDVSRNIERISSKLNLVNWNSEGFKYGICSYPAINYVKFIILNI